MCGGSKSKKQTFPEVTAQPNPGAVADTSNDYNAQRAIAASTDQQTQPATFGAELGG